MFTVIKNRCSSYGVVKLIVDKEIEVSTLPTHYTPGSVAIIIDNSKVYMLSNDKKWVHIKTNSSGGDIPDIPSEVLYDGGAF